MRKNITYVGILLLVSLIIPGHIYPQTWGEWVNNQGCYCGKYPSAPVFFVSKGSGTLAERTATRDQMDYWAMYVGLYIATTIDTGLGAPNNGINEVNTFLTIAQAQTIYGYTMDSSLYGTAILRPEANFGNFNECWDFDISGCGAFIETDIIMNADYGTGAGWTTDPNDYSLPLVQATAVHEIGHTWGAHHVFTLPFGDSYSCMNYMNDDSIRFITRMDANTIRSAYSNQSQTTIDVGIFPFTYGNAQDAETYASVAPTIISTGENLNISNWLIQNIGSLAAVNTMVTFFLSTDTTIAAATDYELGTASFGTLTANTEGDQNTTLPIPAGIPNDTYYVGAIAYVDWAEDGIIINNSFIIGRPSRTQITVTDAATPQWIYDYNGDGTSDVAIYRGSSGLWAIRGVTRIYFGDTTDEAVPGDYNGDSTTDISIYRPSSGLWAIRGITRPYFGSSSDLPEPGDYDGDGTADIGIFRGTSGLWAIRGVTRVYFGGAADSPASGYYDGGATKDIGIFRGSSGLWAIRTVTRLYFGSSSDTIVPGDYDGDGAWETGIFRGSSGLWAIRGVTRSYFGGSTDEPVPADYDGDSIDDIGIFRDSSGLWAIWSISRVYFGASGDLPVTR